jgi:Mrp family chromosome partitioning ATPase
MIEDVLFNPGMPRLVVLPGRATGQPSSEALTSPGMRALLREITRRYDARIVIFDLPPLLRNDDALTFTPYADATLMVVEDGVNTPDEIERSLHLMKNANLIGTILNKAHV